MRYSFGDLLEMRRNAAAAGDAEALQTLDPLIQQMGTAAERASGVNRPDVGDLGTSVGGPGFNIPVPEAVTAGTIAAGQQLEKFGQGAKNIYAGLTGDTEQQEQIAAQQAEAERLTATLREDHPVATMVGSMAPALATIPLGGGLLTQTGIGAGMGAMEYNPNQMGAGMMSGILSAGGYGAGKGIGSVAKVVGETVKRSTAKVATGLRADMLAKADDLGMYLMPGQKSGSRTQRLLDIGIKRSPTTSGLVEEGLENNQKILTRTALEALGESGEEVGENTLANAAKRIGKVYDDLLDSVDDIRLDVNRVNQEMGEMAQDSIPYINTYLKRFPSLAETGRITGKEAGRLRNLIQKDIKLVRQNGKADPDDLIKFQTAILDAAEAAGGQGREQLAKAGQQWRILKALERSNTVTEGAVNAKSLRTGLARYDVRLKRGIAEGGKELPAELQKLYDATKVTNYFQDIVGDSGTASGLHLPLLSLDPKGAIKDRLIKKSAEWYLESGGSPLAMMALGSYPAAPLAGQTGAGLLRGGYIGQ